MPEVELMEHQHHPKTRPEVGRKERGEDFGVMMMNLCQRRPAADGGIALGLGRGKAARSKGLVLGVLMMVNLCQRPAGGCIALGLGEACVWGDGG